MSKEISLRDHVDRENWQCEPTLTNVHLNVKTTTTTTTTTISDAYSLSLCCSSQIRSDKENYTKILYFLSGPGVDQDPKNVFGIDTNTGYVRVYSILDREKIAYYQVKAFSHILFVNTITFPAWIFKLCFVEKEEVTELPLFSCSYKA